MREVFITFSGALLIQEEKKRQVELLAKKKEAEKKANDDLMASIAKDMQKPNSSENMGDDSDSDSSLINRNITTKREVILCFYL